MKKTAIPPFNVTLLLEGKYHRMYITHPYLKGRFKKRIGDGKPEDLEKIIFHLKYELENHFETAAITRIAVDEFINNFISLQVKYTASIFLFFDEFIENKQNSINNKTKNKLSKPTITAYLKAREYFETYLISKKLSSHPAMISKEVLDNFYLFIPGKNNYKVKLHGKIKAFLKYVNKIQGISVNPTFINSVFMEEYDNQAPEENDISLTDSEVLKLIDLRDKLYEGSIKIERNKISEKIQVELQQKQFKLKEENLIRCLDCFLFMASTGQYHSDIMKSKLYFSNRGSIMHLRYRRAKNGSLCRAIPVKNDNMFISKELIEKYKIKNGSNFPLKLSNTHFNIHLEEISALAGFDFKLNGKMARKTFASRLYFNTDHPMPVHLLQIMLGHMNVKNTAHYLRINDDDIAAEIDQIMTQNTNEI
jgi:integrase